MRNRQTTQSAARHTTFTNALMAFKVPNKLADNGQQVRYNQSIKSALSKIHLNKVVRKKIETKETGRVANARVQQIYRHC